ncbi:hypothetical protein ABZ897_43280 [Nonomuraea sp. NPDC046802]|uniref:hypothetical protein n=1 Tax=Nonomuraea sp. NPDC046802 TaxID=3154919 RepID=UPI00340ED188
MTSSSHPDEELQSQVREALVTLLNAMRPDWGGVDAIAGRIRFAENRLHVPLPDICVQAVSAAAIPAMAPDAFIRHNPARRQSTDDAQMKRTIAELRHRLARQAPGPSPAPGAAAADQATEDDEATGDGPTVADERAWLIQAVAPAYAREQARRADFESRHRAVRPAFDGLLPEE